MTDITSIQKQGVNMSRQRLDVFDGLRGVAMMLVLLNHVDSTHIIQAFPPVFQQAISFLFLSGKLGVSFFFILSGFLMAYVYSQPHETDFIERRYARIFPPFIVLVLCMGVFRTYPQFSLFARISIMFAIAYVFRLIWIYIIEKFRLGSLTVKLFLFFQLTIAIWYGFFIMRNPPIWFHSLPSIIQLSTTIAVNATLTLPLGNYIPFFDIVYWSLICEVLFYLVYPFIIAPFILRMQNKSTFAKSFVMCSLFPFFFGTSLLFKEFRGFGVMSIEYFVYFCMGIVVAIKIKKSDTITLHSLMKAIFTPLSFLILLFFSYLILAHSVQFYTIAITIFLSIPFGYIVYGLLDNTTKLHTFLSHKICVFLGAISYSLYICSTPIIDGMRLLYKPINAFTTLLFLIITICVLISVSYCMQQIIETPYFLCKSSRKKNIFINKRNKLASLLLFLFFLISIFSVYSSRFSFLSSEKMYVKEKTVSNILIKDSFKISEKPISLFFTSEENNFGVVLINIDNTVPFQEISNNRLLVVKIKETKAIKWYTTQEINLAKIGNSVSLPFGFPIIKDSKNKKYIIELSTRNTPTYFAPSVRTNPYIFSTIHQMDKKELLTHPTALLSHSLSKLVAFLHNKMTLLIFLCIFPLLLIILFF